MVYNLKTARYTIKHSLVRKIIRGIVQDIRYTKHTGEDLEVGGSSIYCENLCDNTQNDD